jgi:hypothetical protein
MAAYNISLSGSWPNEKYIIKLNPAEIDVRLPFYFGHMHFGFYWAEENNILVDPLNSSFVVYNSTVGLSANAEAYYNNAGDLNIKPKTDLIYEWDPLPLRQLDYGEVFGNVTLTKIDQNTISAYGGLVYPTHLFLYPLSSWKIPNFAPKVENYQTVTVNTTGEFVSFYRGISSSLVSSVNTELTTPLVTSIYYISTASYVSGFDNFSTLRGFISSNSSSWVYQLTSTTNSISSITFYISSNFINYFIDEISLNNFINFSNFYLNLSSSLYRYPSSINYSVSSIVLTGYTFNLQTSTVLLSGLDYTYVAYDGGRVLKGLHNTYLSLPPNTNRLIRPGGISTITYQVCALETYGNRSIIKYDLFDPREYSFILGAPGAKIKRDTLSIAYDLVYNSFLNDTVYPLSETENTPYRIGQDFDDLDIIDLGTINSSSIMRTEINNQRVTFQLLQSTVNLDISLQDTRNCVVSAVVYYDVPSFYYFKAFQEFGVTYSSPISGLSGRDLRLKYVLEKPYDHQGLSLQNSVSTLFLNTTLVPLNSSIDWNSHNGRITWSSKNPSYYYTFKSSYSSNKIKFTDPTTLNFYLTSQLLSKQLDESSENYLDHKIKLKFNSTIFSDYDIIEMPLRDYAFNDFIQYKLERPSTTINPYLISAYYVKSETYTNSFTSIQDLNIGLQSLNSLIYELSSITIIENVSSVYYAGYAYKEPYDIIKSPLVPAISGAELLVDVFLSESGGVFSIRPALSTLHGYFDAFWATTVPIDQEYDPKYYKEPLTITELFEDKNSIITTVAYLTSEENDPGRDLTQSDIVWTIIPNVTGITAVNLTPIFNTAESLDDIINYDAFQDSTAFIEFGKVYNFNSTHTIKLSGYADTPLSVILSSLKYGLTAEVFTDENLFNIYEENKVLLINEYFLNQNKRKKLKINAFIPYFEKTYFISPSASLYWDWSYNGLSTIEDEDDILPVSAFYYDENQIKTLYEPNTPLNSTIISSIFFEIDSAETLTEEFYPFEAKIFLTDGISISGIASYEINTFPSKEIYNPTFTISYSAFSAIFLGNSDFLNVVTRPNNTTNAFIFSAVGLQTADVKISTLKWGIQKNGEDIDIYNVATEALTADTTNIYIIEDLTFYDLISSPLTEYISLSYTDTDILYQNLSSSLIGFSSVELSTPKVTSIYSVISVSNAFTTDSQILINELISSTSNWLQSSVFIDTNLVPNITTINYIFSSNQTNSFIDLNELLNFQIDTTPYLLLSSVFYTPATSITYQITSLQFSNDLKDVKITLSAENVLIPGWDVLYSFESKADVNIWPVNQFSPFKNLKIEIQPLHYWTGKKVFITPLTGTPQPILNSVYGNRTLNSQEFIVNLKNITPDNSEGDLDAVYFATLRTVFNETTTVNYSITSAQTRLFAEEDSLQDFIIETDKINWVLSSYAYNITDSSYISAVYFTLSSVQTQQFSLSESYLTFLDSNNYWFITNIEINEPVESAYLTTVYFTDSAIGTFTAKESGELLGLFNYLTSSEISSTLISYTTSISNILTSIEVKYNTWNYYVINATLSDYEITIQNNSPYFSIVDITTSFTPFIPPTTAIEYAISAIDSQRFIEATALEAFLNDTTQYWFISSIDLEILSDTQILTSLNYVVCSVGSSLFEELSDYNIFIDNNDNYTFITSITTATVQEFADKILLEEVGGNVDIQLDINYQYESLFTRNGMPLYVTAFNAFFPERMGSTFLSLNPLSSNLETLTFPIIAETISFSRYPSLSTTPTELQKSINPKIIPYNNFRFVFYPEMREMDVDENQRVISIKQIIESKPLNSPNEINYELSTVIYTLSSEYWVSTATIDATNQTTDVFNLNVGDGFDPLTVSDFEITSLVLSASALIATRIPPETFSNYSLEQYEEERELWEIIYIPIEANERIPYKFMGTKFFLPININNRPLITQDNRAIIFE